MMRYLLEMGTILVLVFSAHPVCRSRWPMLLSRRRPLIVDRSTGCGPVDGEL